MSNRVKIICLATVLLIAVLGIIGRDIGGDPLEEQTADGDKTLITVGFSQVGAESDWRTANSISIKETFSEENGYDLIFDDAKQKQENQIMAVRSFIQQEVDYIILAPIVESGWDTVLGEARDAGIPVIIIDRMVDVEDDSLYAAWIGSDFKLEGQKACEWIKAYMDLNGKRDINIIHIQGTPGASAQIGRSHALEEAAVRYGWNILAQENGEFTQAKAQEVMEVMLAQYDDIDVVYCENDNEALGVVSAIEDAGMTVGMDGDIMVVSFDAVHEGLIKVLQRKISIDVECNPQHGMKVENIIRQLESGVIPDKQVFVQEEVFAKDSRIPFVEIDGVRYEIKQVTEGLIVERQY